MKKASGDDEFECSTVGMNLLTVFEADVENR